MSRDKNLDWKTSMSFWWSLLWRSSVYGFVGGAVLGAILGAIAGATGHLDKARVWGMVGGYIAGLSLSTLATKQALEKHLKSLAAAYRAPES